MAEDRNHLDRTWADMAGKPAPPEIEERLNAYLRHEALDLGNGLRMWDKVSRTDWYVTGKKELG